MNTDRRGFPAPMLLLSGLLLVGGIAAAAESSVELDEVEVVSMSLRKLQSELLRTENRFYARFNDLNDKDDFDIYCRFDKRTGTQVPKRECRIQFLAETASIDAQEFYRGITGATNSRSVHTPLPALQQQWELRREEYMQTVRRVVDNDPALKALAAHWGLLLEQYEKATRKDD